MDYSTFTNRNFFIKQNSTLPEIKFALTQFIREKYDITDEMLENVAVTFSMIDEETGLYRIANVPANLDIVTDLDEYPDEVKYTLSYRFKLSQTKKPGRFRGEFKLDFLGDNCGKITLPTEDVINIIISSSITKTTVI
jgi:hypothetical protein